MTAFGNQALVVEYPSTFALLSNSELTSHSLPFPTTNMLEMRYPSSERKKNVVSACSAKSQLPFSCLCNQALAQAQTLIATPLHWLFYFELASCTIILHITVCISQIKAFQMALHILHNNA